MYILFLLGRIALVAVFLVSGVQKFMDIAGSADVIKAKFAIPGPFLSLTPQLEAMTGMTIYQLLAIAGGVIEVVLALGIVFNVASRFASIVLLIYLGVITYFVYDFWNQGPAGALAMSQALKNLSIMGALLMLFVIGPARPDALEDEDPYAN